MTGTLKFPPTFCLKNQKVERKQQGVPFFFRDVDHLVFELGSIPKKTCWWRKSWENWGEFHDQTTFQPCCFSFNLALKVSKLYSLPRYWWNVQERNRKPSSSQLNFSEMSLGLLLFSLISSSLSHCGPWNKSVNSISATKYIIPKILKLCHLFE